MRVLSPLLKLASFSLRTLLTWGKALLGWIKAQYARASTRRKKKLYFFLKISFVLVAALLARPTAMQALGRALVLSKYEAVWTQNEADTLESNGFPGGRVIDWLNKELPEDSKFLIYRQAEFSYYVSHDWIYDFDPKIIGLYDVSNKKEAFDYLHTQDITHIFIPNYMPATLYNSPIVDLVGDPRYTRELYSHSGMRLIELFTTPKEWICEDQPGLKSWAQGIIGAQVTFEAGGEGIFGPTSVNAAPKTFTQFQELGSVFSRRVSRPFGAVRTGDDGMTMIWPSDYRDRIGLLSGFGPIYLAPQQTIDRTNVDSVQVTFDIVGNGFLEVWIYEYDSNEAWSSRRLWDAVLKKEKGARSVEIQAQLSSDTVAYRILISNGGSAGGYSEVKGVTACGVNYNVTENTRAELNTNPLLQEGDLALVKDWDLTPVQSSAALNQPGARLLLGRSCYELSFFCRLLNVQGPSRNLLMRPNGSKGFELTMPIDAGFIIASDKVNTSLRTIWQCKLGRRVWFIERSPARDSFVEKIYLHFAKKLLPAGNNPSDRVAQLRLNAQTSSNTVISVALLWKNGKGKKSCYYLGEQALETNTETTYWDFPLPKEYSDLTLTFTTDHPLNNYINLDVSGALVVITPGP